MFVRKLAFVVLAAVAVGVPSSVLAAPQDVASGQIRATFNRRETSLREEAKMTGKVAAKLPYGTTLRVDRVEQPWIQVTVASGALSGRTGWLRAVETVELSVLGTSDRVRATAAAGGAERASFSARDVSAAGRSLGDAGTEQDYKSANPDLASAYPVVDRIEEANRRVDPAKVDAFIAAGRLGRPGKK